MFENSPRRPNYAPSSFEKRFEKLWDDLFPEVVWVRQVLAIPNRRFEFDYQLKEAKLLVECQGSVFVGHKKIGNQFYIPMRGHNSPDGIARDHEKHNLAVSHGYTLFYFSEKLMTEDWIINLYSLVSES